jgi:Heparinase II/III-like protein/Heparinase II/III N-terminus
MQTLTWYARRLQRMSAAEIGWRGRSAMRDVGARVRHALRLSPSLFDSGGRAWPPLDAMPPLCPIGVGEWRNAADGSPESAWTTQLLATADDLVAHRFSFLNLEGCNLGDPIDWNRDHETGTEAPLRFSSTIDYRDPVMAGDAKLVWEPNRHLHLVVLARAYRATGETRYASAAAGQVLAWMRACPFGIGMNWRSPLELAIRAINWTWMLAYLAPALDAGTSARLQHGLDLHVQDIVRKYSRGSSANNHRIGEAAGVFVATSCVPGLRAAGHLRAESLAMLEREILAQTYEDGGSREQAFGYHLFVLQFLLIAAFVATRTKQPLSDAFRSRLRHMIEFVAALTAAGPAPLYGDADDGHVLDLGGARDGRDLVAVGRALLDGPTTTGVECCEPVAWLFGVPPPGDVPRRSAPLTPDSFASSGLYLLQYGAAGSTDSASLTFDCAELGFGSIAAHGHADALAITLRVGGRDLLVDPGTYDYFRYPAWRDYFRSTRAHNTVVVDGADQSVMLGPFMWGERAISRCLEWVCGEGHARIVGEHDGYSRLQSPVRHRRSVTMDAALRRFEVVDELLGSGPHDIELPFHLAADVTADVADDTGLLLRSASGAARLSLDPRLAIRVMHGSESPIAGWVSPGYHRKLPATTIRATLRGTLPLTLRTVIQIEPGEPV